MNNSRIWFLDKGNSELSKVDLVISEILMNYRILLNNINSSNAVDVVSFAEQFQLNREIPNGFRNWFNLEGKEFLVKMANSRFSDDSTLKEELKYVNFIISSEVNNKLLYIEDTAGTMIDLIYKIYELVEVR